MNVSTICAYCGCGCRLNFLVEDGKIKKVLPEKDDEVSEGKPCIKGLSLGEVREKGRILKPMIRNGKGLKEVSWDDAYKYIYKKTKDVDPDDIFFVPSGKITNEDNFVIQKFARIVFKTNNVDGCCSRLCHISTVRGLIDNFGNGAIPTKMNDIYDRDCLFIIGSNPASNYPVIFNRILKIKDKAKIISIQPITARISEFSDISIIINPGTETVLLNGIMNVLIEKKVYDKKVESFEGFKALSEVVKSYPPEKVCDICGIKDSEFNEIVSVIENSKRFGVLHGMGLTQHTNAIENIHSLLNLIILKDGRLLSCRGEVNVQGVGDMGCSPNLSPLGQFQNMEEVEKIWGVKLPFSRGRNIIESFVISPAKVAFISGFNPAQSLPDLDRVHKNLKKMFLVVQEPYFNLTTNFAKVILPTPILMERNGTITNGERRVRPVRKVVEPMGESKPEWLIFKEFSSFFDCSNFFEYKNEKDIFYEITKVIPAYRNINVEKVYKGEDEFADKEVRFCRFIPEQFEGVEDVRSKKYPFILTTFRSQFHFLTDEMSSKSETLNKFDGPFCYINPEDARDLDLKDGDIVKITSSVSSVSGEVKIDNKIPKGVVGAHFHFEKFLVNKLFPAQFDEETFTPNYKLVSVNIRKIKTKNS
ncbi:MAG: molybdopterin-dependent oxidoreductase [Candidatus Aenigmatarchaeota archaeon]